MKKTKIVCSTGTSADHQIEQSYSPEAALHTVHTSSSVKMEKILTGDTLDLESNK